MGHKVHPLSFRIGAQDLGWSSRWFGRGEKYKDSLIEDIKLRQFLLEKLKPAGISKIEIERSADRRVVILYVSRPGIVIGRGGSGLEELKKMIAQKLNIADPAKLDLRVEEIRQPELNAYLVATSIADQLIKRLPARRITSQTAERVVNAGAKGVRIVLSGRIAGAEIARRESIKIGKMPLHTLRANIDFAKIPALTKSGFIGVKVWIYLGES